MCFVKKVYLKIHKIHKKTPALEPQAKACDFIKKETLPQVFSCEFCKISKNTFFTEHLRATASADTYITTYWLLIPRTATEKLIKKNMCRKIWRSFFWLRVFWKKIIADNICGKFSIDSSYDLFIYQKYRTGSCLKNS